MVFSSTIFVFVLLPITIGVYFLLPKRMRNGWLLLASIWFYAWGEPRYLPLVITATVLDYSVALVIAGAWRGGEIRQLDPNGPRTRVQKIALITAICGNLGMLAVFKYFHFLVDNWNALVASLGAAGWQWQPAFQIALPLGISFYTFQTLSYSIDVYRGHTKATRNLLNYLTFDSFFPQLVAGPIVRYTDVEEELRRRSESMSDFAAGCRRFTIGLAKKLLVANTVAVPADRIFALPPENLTTGLAWLAVLCYTIQIYYDFSGYSDMAIGLARMFGFKYPENFNYPYTARSITEFWRRWHMTLSGWLRDYLYIPLGGNRKGPARTYINLVIVFFLCGLWHGAAWTFVFWGMYHGIFLVLERVMRPRIKKPPRPAVAHLYTLAVVIVSWVFFRSDTLGQGFTMLAAMAGLAPGFGEVYNVGMFATGDVLAALLLGAIFSAPVLPWLRAKVAAKAESSSNPGRVDGVWGLATTAGTLALLLVSLMQLSSGTHNPFIYYWF